MKLSLDGKSQQKIRRLTGILTNKKSAILRDGSVASREYVNG
jgi:hypothetical protein